MILIILTNNFYQRKLWGMTLSCISICIILALLLPLTFTKSSISIESQRGLQSRLKLEKDSGKSIGTYRALIIGINKYNDKKIDDLETPENDAKSIANILKSDYGFTDVKLLLNDQATSSKIQKELRRLASQINENDSVLLYYAGHGDLDRITKNGWWLPHDAIAQDPSTYIENTTIQNYIRAMPARHVLLVSDSCFSGTLFGQSRTVPPVIDDKFYATLFKEKSRWGITSGNLTPVTDTGTDGHSLFAYQFIKSLKENNKPYLTPREIYQEIAPIISNNSEQMPIVKPIKNANDQGGEFIFIRTKSTVVSIPSTQTTTITDMGDKQRLLDAERKALGAERKRLDEEKKLMEEHQKLDKEHHKLDEKQQKLDKEHHKLDEERERFNKEKVKVASKPQKVFHCPLCQLRYIDNRDGTISDTKTGLMWTKKDSFADLGKCLNWNDSKEYVRNLKTGSYNNWKFPTIKELRSIFEISKSSHLSINPDPISPDHLDSIFSDGASNLYWSSDDESILGSSYAEVFKYKSGFATDFHKNYCWDVGVRAVR